MSVLKTIEVRKNKRTGQTLARSSIRKLILRQFSKEEFKFKRPGNLNVVEIEKR